MSASYARPVSAPAPLGRPIANGHARRFAVRALQAAIDLASILLPFIIGYRVHRWLYASGVGLLQPTFDTAAPYARLALLFGIIALLAFWGLGLYHPKASVLNLWEQQMVIAGMGLAAACFFALLFFLRIGGFSRAIVVGAILLATLVVLLERRFLAGILGRVQLSGRSAHRVLIYGCDDTGRLLMKKLVQAPHVDSRVIGFIDDAAMPGTVVSCRIAQTEQLLFQAPVLGRWNDFADIVQRHAIDELLVVASAATGERLRDIFEFCRDRSLRVGIVPHIEDFRADQLLLDDLSAIPVLRPHSPVARRGYLLAKRAFDIVGALALLIVTSPLWALATLLVLVASRGPLFFVQDRIGQHGRSFRMLKFRTMSCEANPYAHSPPRDVGPHITRVGRLLRASGFDELPQLLNVLRGDMSLVGPRPEMPFIVERYTSLQRKRLEVKPGLTGLWQLSADRHAEIHENIEYDLYYISHQSLMLDALILFETFCLTLGAIAALVISRNEERARAVPGPSTAPRMDEPYVLLALDQRRSDGIPAAWETFVPAAFAISDRWPVRMLVAGGNVEVYDQLLHEPMRRLGTRNRRCDYAFYGTRAELRALVHGARVVVSDLSHAALWAHEAGARLLAVRGSESRPSVRGLDGDEIIDALTGSLHGGAPRGTATLADIGREIGSIPRAGPPPPIPRADAAPPV